MHKMRLVNQCAALVSLSLSLTIKAEAFLTSFSLEGHISSPIAQPTTLSSPLRRTTSIPAGRQLSARRPQPLLLAKAVTSTGATSIAGDPRPSPEDGSSATRLSNAATSPSPSGRRDLVDDVIKISNVKFVRWRNKANVSADSSTSDDSEKPLLLYLPGIEGLGTSVEPQLPALSSKFDVFRLIIGAEDRSTFFKLTRAVTEFVDTVGKDVKTVVVGESFGGMLALRLGQLRPDRIQAIFPINPATSFGRTPWTSLGPLLSFAPTNQYKAASVAVFAATIPDRSQMLSVVDMMFDGNKRLSERPKALADYVGGLWGMISEVSDNLPPATLRWRTQNWLSAGQGRVERGLADMKVPVTIIAGSADRLLPSAEESDRLKNIIRGSRRIILEGHGHAPLFDGRVNLAEIIADDPALEGVSFLEAKADGANDDAHEGDEKNKQDEEVSSMLSRVYAKDWVSGYQVPDDGVIQEGRNAIDFLLKSVSPVFFSTTSDGTSVPGLSGVPDRDPSRPILFVGNHQLMALDLGVIVERLYTERGILARGLAHPMVFMGQTTPRVLDGAVDSVVKRSEEIDNSHEEHEQDKQSKGDKDMNNMQTFFAKFGAVPVSPRNMFRLLERGDNVLLFPGGVHEAYHKKGEDYKLFWPEKAEFVRLAARSGAIIVPFSAVGIADSLEMVLDGDELLDVPILGNRLRERSSGTPSARGGSSKEQFVPPFVLPKLPARVYVRFGEAIDLAGLDRKDKAACQEAYERVKDEVELGIDSLLRAREQDPYLDPATRLLYERVKGEAAPTFAAPELDAAVTRTRLVRDGKSRRRGRQGGQARGSGDSPLPSVEDVLKENVTIGAGAA